MDIDIKQKRVLKHLKELFKIYLLIIVTIFIFLLIVFCSNLYFELKLNLFIDLVFNVKFIFLSIVITIAYLKIRNGFKK